MPDYLWHAEESLGRRVALAPLVPLEWLYRAGAMVHRTVYDLGLRSRARLPARVISIGNLAVGGSGKTPLVAFLAAALRSRGAKVAILSRGVGGRARRDVTVVSDGERVLADVGEVGDEPVWLASVARGVPVLAGANRAALGYRALAVFGADVLLVDDGFQHHPLARDLDLVCLDARLGLGNGHVLPRGPLRESPSLLRRADALVWTRVAPGAEAPPPPGAAAGRPACFAMEIGPSGLREIAVSSESKGAGATQESVDWLRGRAVGLLAAIARPDRFRADLERLGARVERAEVFADHHRYRRLDLERLDPRIDWITTAKDAVKIPPEWVSGRGVSGRGVSGRRVWVLEESVRPGAGPSLVEWIARRLAAPKGSR